MELEASLLYVARVRHKIELEMKQKQRKSSTLRGAIHAGTSRLTDISALECLKTMLLGRWIALRATHSRAIRRARARAPVWCSPRLALPNRHSSRL